MLSLFRWSVKTNQAIIFVLALIFTTAIGLVWFAYTQLKTTVYSTQYSGNVEAVVFKFGTRNVHHKQNKFTPVVLLP